MKIPHSPAGKASTTQAERLIQGLAGIASRTAPASSSRAATFA